MDDSSQPDHSAGENHRGVAVRRGRMALCLVAVAVAVLSIAAATALASTGALTGQGCIQNFGRTDCGVTAPGLITANGVAASPDGKSVYVTSLLGDAIVRFDRDTTTGALTPQGCIADAGISGCGVGVTQQGLDAATGVAVSPDGKSVYVASQADDAIVRFDRDTTTGALTGAGCIQDVGKADCGTNTQGHHGAYGVAVSPDNKSVYVASAQDNAIVRFDRDTTTGALTGQGCIADVGKADCGLITQQGLDGANGVAASPDGRSVYVASIQDRAVVRFDRDTATGALTGQGCIADVGDAAGCGTTQQGLASANGVAVSPDGRSVYVASQTDDAIVRFNREDPPETQIDSGPSGTTSNTTPTFTFSSDEGNVTFACSVDGAAFAACSGPGNSHTTAALADGAHTFEVRAADTFGTADPSPASRAFTVDTTAPVAPAITASSPASPANDNNPELTGSAEAGSTVSLYTSADCTGSPAATDTAANFAAPGVTATVADDSTTSYTATATDTTGHTSPCSAGLTYVEDSTAPETTIASGPANGSTTNDRTPAFGFTSSEAGSSFECKVDGGSFAACSSPNTTAALADGAHTFKVRATDHAGNTDPTPASRSFTVDTHAPNTKLTGGPPPVTTKHTATFKFKSTERGSSFKCKLDRQRFKRCRSPKTYKHLKRGKHAFKVEAIDRAGNVDRTPAKRSWRIR